MSSLSDTAVLLPPVSPLSIAPVAVRQPVGRVASHRIYWTPLLGIIGIHLGALLAFAPLFTSWAPLQFSWRAVACAVVLQWMSGCLGVTLGMHRLLTHRSFKTFKPIEYFLALLGSINLQGGPIQWVATHRLHHQHSDGDEDPHSPKHGFFWSHCLWCFTYDPKFDLYEKYSRYALDMARDPVHVFIEKTTVLWQFVLAGLLYLIGGWPFVIWGIFVRLVYVYHITWFVNSAAHTWGYRNFETTDESRNLWWVGLTAFGEGWHNNHHAYPRSARHGLKPWEFDCTWLTIKLMSRLGLAWDIRLPEQGASREGC